MAMMIKELVANFKTNATMKQQNIDARRDKKWMKMAEMYFKVGEEEKGMTLLVCIEKAEEGKHTSATIESSTVPGDIAIQKCSPDGNVLLGNNSDKDTDDDK